MDGQRFDALARTLATARTRRTIFRGLLGAGGLVSIGRRNAAAQDCGTLVGIGCQGDGECQGTGNVPLCPSNACCGGACTDLGFDPLNCGSCGNACQDNASCQGGQCVAFCPDGQLLCGNGCVDLANDPSNCGDCGVICPSQSCCGGVCADLQFDPTNCGGCGIGCGNGTCCLGTCIDPLTDPANCGGCGAVCADGDRCDQGICVRDCPNGTTNCGGACVDLTTDPANCGDCGATCIPEADCVAGECQLVCPDSTTPCDGACIDAGSDPANCGGCGISCGSDACCAGICSDLTSDPANCGACGQVCDGQRCAEGVCGRDICSVEQANEGLVFRFVSESPDDGLSISTISILQTDDTGQDTGVSSQTAISRGAETVLELDRETSIDGTWTITVHYGPAFQGIGEAVFSGRSGQPIEGLIDGRPLQPFDDETDLARIAFASDEPTPEMNTEPGLAEALGRLFARANEEVAACLPPELEATPGAAFGVMVRKGSQGSMPGITAGFAIPAAASYCDPGHITYPPLGSTGCVACRAGCMAAGGGCAYGVATGCAAASAVCLVGYGACLAACLVIGIAGCIAGEIACLTACRKPGGYCCPVGCGDGTCCLGSEICLDASTTLCCGDPFSKPCQNRCCCGRNDTCLQDGTCCPAGVKVCNNACCEPGDTCFSGGCCAKVCDAVSPSVCCGQFDSCSRCGCCPPGTTCAKDVNFRDVCCPTGQLCGEICCPNGQVCQDEGSGTCFSASGCPADQGPCTGGFCCDKFTLPNGQVFPSCCGNVCCPSETPYCCVPGDDLTEPVCNPIGRGCIR